jgi:NADH-quinone oxidoreductase subunit H
MSAAPTISQMISYSLTFSLVIFSVALVNGTVDLMAFLQGYTTSTTALLLLPFVLVYLISILAETNRPPFDLAEAESELVAGFFTEHAAFTFALFFLGEFTNLLAIATLFSILFIGHSLFSVMGGLFATFMILFIFVIRATLSRVRFDSLLAFGWKGLLPFSAAFTLFILAIINLM